MGNGVGQEKMHFVAQNGIGPKNEESAVSVSKPKIALVNGQLVVQEAQISIDEVEGKGDLARSKANLELVEVQDA